MSKILKYTEQNKEKIISKTVRVLKKSGLVVFPSDTVYGLLADANNESAIKKLINFKNRPPGKPISVFVNNFLMLKEYVYLNKNQENILKNILPGQFTIILPSKHKVSPLLESEKKTLGIRLIKFSLVNNLVQKLGRPITATSANLAGKSPHYSIKNFLKQIPKNKLNLIDLIVDYGKLPRNKPSTIVDLSQEEIKILRHGDVEFNQKKTFISQNEEETKEIAKNFINFFLKQNRSLKKSLIFLLKGELGVGKTEFTKGIGQYFNLKNIISPSFVIYYEYSLKNDFFKNFYHFDFYNIKESEEFAYLGLDKILEKKNLIIIEWGEKTGEIVNSFKKKAKIIWVTLDYLNKDKRKIEINF